MTIREWMHEWSNYTAPEWMCKFTWGNISCRPNQTEWNWLDFTLGELCFTIFVIFIFVLILRQN